VETLLGDVENARPGDFAGYGLAGGTFRHGVRRFLSAVGCGCKLWG
jgi:hypothetical protein